MQEVNTHSHVSYMNLYVRYFEQETLATSLEQVFTFLSSIPDLVVDQALIDDISEYAVGSYMYPKRYKVRPRVYFIVIKTQASSLEEFKANKKENSVGASNGEALSKKEAKINMLSIQREGWYEGKITFKRVIPIPGTLKFQYQDTVFSAYVRANSGLDCYEKMIAYLKNRQDVDLRSQFPSARGSNFAFSYINLPALQEG